MKSLRVAVFLGAQYNRNKLPHFTRGLATECIWFNYIVKLNLLNKLTHWNGSCGNFGILTWALRLLKLDCNILSRVLIAGHHSSHHKQIAWVWSIVATLYIDFNIGTLAETFFTGGVFQFFFDLWVLNGRVREWNMDIWNKNSFIIFYVVICIRNSYGKEIWLTESTIFFEG